MLVNIYQVFADVWQHFLSTTLDAIRYMTNRGQPASN